MLEMPPETGFSTGVGRGRFFRAGGLLVLAAACLLPPAVAQDAADPAGVENAAVEDDESGIAVIDLKRAVESVADFQTAAEQWTAQMQRVTAEIQADRDQFEQLQQRLSTQQDALNASTRAALIRQAEDLQIGLARKEQDVQEELNALRQQLLLPITEKVDRAVAAYAEERGLFIVFDISNPLFGMTLVKDAIDITNTVIERVDAMN